VGLFDHLLTTPPPELTVAEKLQVTDALHEHGVRIMRDKISGSRSEANEIERALGEWLSRPVVLGVGQRLK